MNGVGRGSAHLVSRDAQDRPAYGGTPSDSAVVQAIQELKARGYRVTFYPFILMDVPADNDAAGPVLEQRRGDRPAGLSLARAHHLLAGRGLRRQRRQDRRRGHAGRRLLRRRRSRPTSTSTTSRVEWDGDPDDWGLRRMILHYAHLCAAAGGVDAFLIGSELRGITQVRSGASSYPAVAELVDLAADVRVDPRVRHQAQLRRRLVGVLRAPPAGRLGRRLLPPRPALGGRRRSTSSASTTTCRSSDWRDGLDHLDAASADAITDLDYLRGNVEGGEGFDWFYASAADREAQVRTPITDGAARASRGSSATRTSAAGGRTRTATGRAGSRAARRRRGCRRASRSASPRSAARRSTAARTSRTSSTTRSRPRASCRTSPAAGATTPCSGASSRRCSATGPSRRTTRCRASTPAG